MDLLSTRIADDTGVRDKNSKLLYNVMTRRERLCGLLGHEGKMSFMMYDDTRAQD